MFGRRQQHVSGKNKGGSQQMQVEVLEGRAMMSANMGLATDHVPHIGHSSVEHVAHLGRGMTVNPATPKVTPAPTPAPAPVAPTFNNNALTITHVSLNGGTALEIDGSSGNEKITISETTGTSGNSYTLTNGTWSTTIIDSAKQLIIKGAGGTDSITLDASVMTNAIVYGGAGNDTLTGGSGNDRIYAGAGSNVVNGGAGDDTIVTLGSSADNVTGGAGNDSFWMDAINTEVVTDLSTAESKMNNHRVASFLAFTNANGSKTPVSSNLNGQSLQEPTFTQGGISYSSFSTNPLFGTNGPMENDIQQGYVGDCYFVATLSSIAKINPARIQQSIVDLGDGTYAVQFARNGQNSFVRIDGNLPVWSGSHSLAYANTGSDGSTWVALMEKAFTEFRSTTQSASYNNIESGWMDEAYSALGTTTADYNFFNNADSMMTQVDQLLKAGKSVTMAVNQAPADAQMVSGHAYTIDRVETDASGKKMLVVRNPWAVDGYGTAKDGVNDGYVKLTAAQAYSACWGITAGTV